ncbi:MAG: peptidoglycan editing factor PgeF [Deinococcaceae bacterium]
MWHCVPGWETVGGFSDRHGGVSLPPYDTLNFDDREDDPSRVRHNRNLALSVLGYSVDQLCFLNQIHSAQVCHARPGSQEGDALVSDQKGQILAVATADCYPILLTDPVAGVIAAVHAGWRGTLNRIVCTTLDAMLQLGAHLGHIQMAIGAGISFSEYTVGRDLTEQFLDSGFPREVVFQGPVGDRLDLLTANRWLAESFGVLHEHIWCWGRCSTESDFFSYRRDQGKTGRMWAVIGQ